MENPFNYPNLMSDFMSEIVRYLVDFFFFYPKYADIMSIFY